MRDTAIRALAILLALVLVLGAYPQASAAAGKDDSPSKKSNDANNRAPAKEVDRLPNFYGPVVNPEQRIEIYTIQDDYRDRIADLKSQLEATIAERDAKIEGVLTPAQRKQVREAEAESKAKTQERRSDTEETDAPGGSGKSAVKESERVAPEKAAPTKSAPAKTPAAKSVTGKAATGKAAAGKAASGK